MTQTNRSEFKKFISTMLALGHSIMPWKKHDALQDKNLLSKWEENDVEETQKAWSRLEAENKSFEKILDDLSAELYRK